MLLLRLATSDDLELTATAAASAKTLGSVSVVVLSEEVVVVTFAVVFWLGVFVFLPPRLPKKAGN